MKLTWHIIRKDFMRLKWPLAGWALCHAVKIGIGFSIIFGIRIANFSDNSFETVTGWLAAVPGLLTFVITAMLVQEDALVGTTPFWITRPISNGRLFAAKLVGWLVLLWLPAVLLALPWWVTCGFGAREIGWAALEILVFQVAVAIPAALVASLTDTLGRVLIWSFVLLFAAVTIPMMTSWWVGKEMSGMHTAAGWIVFLAAVVAVIVRQFFRRGFVRSLVWLGVGVALAPVAAVVMEKAVARLPADLRERSQGRPKWTDVNPDRAKDISLSLHSFSANSQGRPVDSKEIFLYSNLSARGVPPGLIIAGDAARQSWRWPGGLELTRDSSWVNMWGTEPRVRALLAVGEAKRDPETERFQAQQLERAQKRQVESYVRRVQAQNQLRQTIPIGAEVTAMIRPSMIERMKRDAPAYQATVQLALLRPVVWFEVPFRPGGWQSHAAYGFRLGTTLFSYTTPERREDTDGKFVVERRPISSLPIVFTMPGALWDSIFYPNTWLRGRWRIPVFYSINRAGGDFQRQHVYFRYPRLTIAGVGITRDNIRVSPPMIRRGDQWVPRDDNWLSEAKLVLVGHQEEARFTREVKAERYENPK